MKRGLVLAGGFVVGVAWELGVLRGLQDVNADLLANVIAADVVVGSAGSTVAAEIRFGASPDPASPGRGAARLVRVGYRPPHRVPEVVR